jgi:hypothetical protein
MLCVTLAPIPVQRGFAGPGANAWRNTETQSQATKREFMGPTMNRL